MASFFSGSESRPIEVAAKREQSSEAENSRPEKTLEVDNGNSASRHSKADNSNDKDDDSKKDVPNTNTD